MARAFTFARRASLDPMPLLRLLIVSGCGISLLAAGPVLPI
ncbi:hypothetical protein [Qipengyuania sediminis]|nr:hypothetical protein [Qipengyuania sediminis]